MPSEREVPGERRHPGRVISQIVAGAADVVDERLIRSIGDLRGSPAWARDWGAMSSSATRRPPAEGQPETGAEDTARDDRLRLLADLVPHLIWVSDHATRIVFCNRWAADYTGWSSADQRAADDNRWLDLLHPEESSAVRAKWQEANRTGTQLEITCRIRRFDGQFRHHEVHRVPVRDSAGRVVEWVGTATDVEDRTALADELRLTQHKTHETSTVLEILQTAAPVGFGLLDGDLTVLRVNKTLAELAGTTPELADHRPFDQLAPAPWSDVVDACRRAVASGTSIRGLALPDGDHPNQTWSASCHPVRIDAGTTGVGLVMVDVSQYRRNEEFRTVIMNNMSEGVYSTDEQGRLTSLNPAAARMLGWAEADVLGEPAHDLLHGRRPDGTPYPADQCPMADARLRGEVVTVADEVLTCKDGALLPVSYSATPLRVGSTVTGVITVFHDTTDTRRQRQREVEVRHDQKLESLGRLSAGLAHEINTPIQFVGDNTRFLASAYQDMLKLLLVYRHCMTSGHLPWQERQRLSDEAEEVADIEYLAAEVPVAVEQSLEGIDRVASLVRAMKSFSYKESNDKAYADLNEAIRTTVTVARNEVKYVADVELDLADLPEVLCHVGDLNQVFLNLLVNAADAMEDKGDRGKITVRTRVEGPYAVLTFADNGEGIPQEIQQTIFEPFFTTKEVGKGTGQGLALARATVCDKHDGTIELNSKVGEGTEFVLRLPITGKAAKAT